MTMEQDATGGQPTGEEAQSAPPEEPVATNPGGPPAGAAEDHADGGRVEMAKEKLEEVKEKLGPKIEEAKEKLGPKIDEAKEKLGPKIDEAKEKVGPKIEEAGNKLKPAFEKIKGLVQQLLDKLRKKPAA
jgi:hypothetical protein